MVSQQMFRSLRKLATSFSTNHVIHSKYEEYNSSINIVTKFNKLFFKLWDLWKLESKTTLSDKSFGFSLFLDAILSREHGLYSTCSSAGAWRYDWNHIWDSCNHQCWNISDWHLYFLWIDKYSSSLESSQSQSETAVVDVTLLFTFDHVIHKMALLQLTNTLNLIRSNHLRKLIYLHCIHNL